MRHISCDSLLLAAGFLGLVMAGCTEPPPRLTLSSSDSAVKAMTLRRIGNEGTKDPAVIAKIVDELNNDDPAVRLYAYEALRKVVGSDYPYWDDKSCEYRWFDREKCRAAAIARWKQWLAAGGRAVPATQTAKASSGSGD